MNNINEKIQINLKSPLSNYIKAILILDIIYKYIKYVYPEKNIYFYDNPKYEDVYIKFDDTNYALEFEGYEFNVLNLVKSSLFFNVPCDSLVESIYFSSPNWQIALDKLIGRI